MTLNIGFSLLYFLSAGITDCLFTPVVRVLGAGVQTQGAVPSKQALSTTVLHPYPWSYFY